MSTRGSVPVSPPNYTQRMTLGQKTSRSGETDGYVATSPVDRGGGIA